MEDHKQAWGIHSLARGVVSLWLPNVIERNKRCSKMLSLRYVAETDGILFVIFLPRFTIY